MVDNNTRNAPVIVIGSGPGGSAAALALLDAGAPTLLMEAGSDTFDLGLTARVGGVTVAKRRPPLQRRNDFRMLGDPATTIYEEIAPGGLSNQWSCAVPRFSEEDFLDAERAGVAYRWPLRYADLVPWYESVEARLHIAGSAVGAKHLPCGVVERAWQLAPEWSAVRTAAESADRSITVMPYANGASTMLTRSATAFNTYSQLLLPRIRDGRLGVLYGARAQSLEWSENDQRVVAVVYRDEKRGETRRVACSGVVVAAGTVNSAQLLFASRSAAHPGGLGNQYGLVGRYLHDHPLAKLIVTLPQAKPIYPASYITRQALDAAPPLYAAAFMQWCGTPALAKTVLMGRPGRSRSVGFSVFGTMVPTPDTRVAFEVGPNAGPPSVRLSYPREVYETLERARDELLAILTRAGWGPRVGSWTVEPPGESVHYGGTCRMHESPEFGVVDGFGRVHGSGNVVVGDSSVFTTGPEKNPVLTAMAIAARSADKLARELR